MRTLRLLLGLLALLGLAVVLPAIAAAAPTLPLSQQGRWITDADGRVTILHGHNMVYKRPPYDPAVTGFGEDDAEFLAREGYNTIRLGLIYKAVEPSPGRYDDAYLDKIAETVETLGRHGIVSQLDFHQDLYNERFQGEGWPDWAVQDDGLPAEPKLGFPANYLAMPALQRAFDHFWANDPGPGGVGLQDRYAAAWRHVASRFKDHRFVMGYDLMNEPWPGTLWQQCANPAGCPVFDATMRGFIDRTIAAIRQVDKRNIIWYEPNSTFNSGADTQVGVPPGDPLGFSFHDYCLEEGAAKTITTCPIADELLVFRNAEDHSRESGDALLLSEFGATDRAETIGGMVERAERHMVSWQHWHYCACDDPTTVGPGDTQAIVIDPAKPPAGANLKAAKLGLLSRAYPRVVGGTPRSYDFDPADKSFELRYSTSKVGGDGRFGRESFSEVVLPERQYPDGWAARVEGGAIVPATAASSGSARPAQATAEDDVLTVEPCPGVEDITVSVTPTGQTSDSCAASAEAAAAEPDDGADPGGSGGSSDPGANDAGAAGDTADGSGDGGSLPFTGLTLALLVVAGATLLSAGILLRGRVRPSAGP